MAQQMRGYHSDAFYMPEEVVVATFTAIQTLYRNMQANGFEEDYGRYASPDATAERFFGLTECAAFELAALFERLPS